MEKAIKIFKGAFKAAFVVAIVLCVIFAIRSISILCLNENNAGVASSITNVVTALVAFVNLLFIASCYIYDGYSKKKQEANTYKIYWYKTFCLENSKEFINQYFETCKSIIYEATMNKGTEAPLYFTKYFSKLSDSINELKDKTAYILIIINKNSGNDLLDFINEKLEDDFIEELSNYIMDPSAQVSEIEKILSSAKLDFFKKLYSYGERLYL